MKIFGIVKYALILVLGLCHTQVGFAAGDEVRPLSSYPKAKRIWMGLEEGMVKPKSYLQVRSLGAGYLQLLAADGELVAKNRHWGTLDPEEVKLSERALSVSESKLETKLKEVRKAQKDALTRDELALSEAEGEIRNINIALQSEDAPPELKKRLGEAVILLTKEIQLLNEATAPDGMAEKLRLEEEEGKIQLERERKEVFSLRKRSELVAPFEGSLNLSDSLKEKLSGTSGSNRLVWLDANELIGTLVDNRSMEIVISGASPMMNQIPKEDLMVLLEQNQTGRLVTGNFDRVLETDNGGEIQQSYVFSVAGESFEIARHSTGQRNLVHVYRKLPDGCRIIYKKDIAFLHPQILEASGWDGLVMNLWPHCRIIQVAPQTIAVTDPNEH